jgi:hypothetical protein
MEADTEEAHAAFKGSASTKVSAIARRARPTMQNTREYAQDRHGRLAIRPHNAGTSDNRKSRQARLEPIPKIGQATPYNTVPAVP